MTKFQKQMLTIAAAGALTAVTALPAMALENEFHGLFNIYGDYGNMAATGSNSGAPTNFLSTNNKADNYIEQRVRLQYIAKASDDLKLVTHFEINNRWGFSNTVPAGTMTSGSALDVQGSDIDTDGLNIVVKHAYLDVNVAKNLNVKAGLQAYKDTIGGILVDADLPMVLATTKIGSVGAVVGFSRYGDTTSASTNTAQLGNQTGNFALADFSYAVNKDSNVGASYYYQSDESTTATIKKTVNTFALNGKTVINGISLKGFVAMQDGEGTNSTTNYKGYAYNLQADAKVGVGAAKLGFLYVSGNTKTGSDNSQFQTLGTTGSTFNDGGMMLMVRNNYYYPTSTGYAMKGNTVSNVQLAYAGYSAMLSDKLKATANLGFGWDNTDVGTTAGTKGDFIGTEVNAELAYKLYPNLNVYAQAGYISLGSQYDAYKDPYAVRLGASFSF